MDNGQLTMNLKIWKIDNGQITLDVYIEKWFMDNEQWILIEKLSYSSWMICKGLENILSNPYQMIMENLSNDYRAIM